ncbi:4-hydroxy-tetrahydrodipicolinate synthase [Flavobacteriaceae bacterium S0825]|uniref:4-hydroxy-tetrahydrodipicolinate synthase n=1 Tax=Gaetbulibacter sp. S0825 TaxID=2720084 RepID=UPI0014317FDE|nr:4-hydroxy-tetrahydrodipicolinate synthase [Gaetbulibacter sp. S0825]MCK0109180.1 4-hydroxy-tetrahydrodipicolinate synthase [Flavobacteriaceae bacterium S0825]NIX64815.1 4-hydroxy-tetrahydrodipicolinate synthase [Gaetbulibacter sp. S0825]
MSTLIGTGVALVTPFKDDLSVDHEALSNIVKFNIDNDTNYLVISGTTGESVTISKQEKLDIITTVKKTNAGKLPLVLGIGGNNTTAVIDEIKNTDLSDFAAILSVAPYYSKPTQEGFYQHFRAISQVCPIPIILYNVPGRTAKNMLPETTLRLAKDFDNIVAVKEAGNNQQQYLELLKDKPKDFLIISGDDDLALGVTLAGGSGVISVLGQAFPKDFSRMIQLGLEGKAAEAYQLHKRFIKITNLIFEENNPAGIKAVLETLNLCKDIVRLPLVPATKDLKHRINNYVEQY